MADLPIFSLGSALEPLPKGYTRQFTYGELLDMLAHPVDELDQSAEEYPFDTKILERRPMNVPTNELKELFRKRR